jgi:hypothetical protein
MLSLLSWSGAAGSPPPLPSVSPAERQRGVCFVAGDRVGEDVFADLSRSGVTWISQTPFGWQRSAHDPDFRVVTGGAVYWGERDVGLRETARLARRHGIHTLLKPHLWLIGSARGDWSGSISMRSEAAWKSWFSRYEEFIVHYARLAEESGMEALCIGTELEGTTSRERDWRKIIAVVRRVYHGRLTYAANWSGEFERIRFWDALDYVGVQAYFPLARSPGASTSDLVAAWTPVRARLEALSRRTGKPVLFTEVGYRSARGAAVSPWKWRSGDPVFLEEQARCYESVFRVFWNRPWFAGTYWWKWFPSWDGRRSNRDRSFTPQGKPALQILSRWYRNGSAQRLETRD